jgi:hypothetical protein
MSLNTLGSIALAAVLVSAPAWAQYQWREANGRMVYSDLPPPASVAPSAVLRTPTRTTDAQAATATEVPRDGGAPAANTKAASAAPSLNDRELDYRKRRLERADAERKAAETAAQAKRQAAACDDARAEIRALESGQRIARVDERGERQILDDTQRASRLDAARQSVQENCKG